MSNKKHWFWVEYRARSEDGGVCIRSGVLEAEDSTAAASAYVEVAVSGYDITVRTLGEPVLFRRAVSVEMLG